MFPTCVLAVTYFVYKHPILICFNVRSHRVDEEVVDALQDQLLESMMTNETEGGTE